MKDEITTSSSRILNTLDIDNLSKGRSFNGKRKDWEDWKVSAVAFFSNLGLGSKLRELSNYQKKVPSLVEMTSEERELANMFYTHLAQMLKGTARKIATQCEIGNGIEIWWRLLQRYGWRVKR